MNNSTLKWSEWLKLCENLSIVEEDFIQVIDSLNTTLRVQKIAEGSWSAKDILSHIVGWELEVVKQFKTFLTNPDVDDNYDIDSFNKSAVELRKHSSWDQIAAELKTAQAELSAFLSKLTQKEIDEEKRFIEWVDILVNHYIHHTKQLKQLT
jgi:uncharacterized damage-inducible protein DinB